MGSTPISPMPSFPVGGLGFSYKYEVKHLRSFLKLIKFINLKEMVVGKLLTLIIVGDSLESRVLAVIQRNWAFLVELSKIINDGEFKSFVNSLLTKLFKFKFYLL